MSAVQEIPLNLIAHSLTRFWKWELSTVLGIWCCVSRAVISHWCHPGAVSIRKTVLPGMAIPMLKIRRPNGRLIFNMEITIRRYDGLYIETGPSCWKVEAAGSFGGSLSICPFLMPKSSPTTLLTDKASHVLTPWGRDKMAAIFQTTFSDAFSQMKVYIFRLRFHWSLFPRVQSTIFQHWFR